MSNELPRYKLGFHFAIRSSFVRNFPHAEASSALGTSSAAHGWLLLLLWLPLDTTVLLEVRSSFLAERRISISSFLILPCPIMHSGTFSSASVPHFLTHPPLSPLSSLLALLSLPSFLCTYRLHSLTLLALFLLAIFVSVFHRVLVAGERASPVWIHMQIMVGNTGRTKGVVSSVYVHRCADRRHSDDTNFGFLFGAWRKRVQSVC